MAHAKRLLLLAAAAQALRPTKLPPLKQQAKAIASTLAAVGLALAPLAGVAEETSAGFEEFAAQGGTMEARPECFFDECGDQSKACFTNPSCLKGVTCLGNCRGEQECATRCFARFGSEKLNDWLSCTLEEKKCVVTGVKQDTSAFYATAPQRLSNFDRKALEGKWWKVRGYNAKYDCFPCQVGCLCGNQLGAALYAIDAAPARWRRGVTLSLLDVVSSGLTGRLAHRSTRSRPRPMACATTLSSGSRNRTMKATGRTD